MSALVLLSGGMDSAVLLYHVLYKLGYSNVYSIGFDYGQRNKKELKCAKKLATDLSIKYDIIKCDLRQFGGSSCLTTNNEVPSASDNKQKNTIVPARNSIFLSLATAYAEINKISDIFIGCCLDDFRSYPDCRHNFIDSFGNAMRLGNDIGGIYAPFVKMNKEEIVKIGLSYDVPFFNTWSCYNNDLRPCFACDACVERYIAMKYNNRKYWGEINE